MREWTSWDTSRQGAVWLWVIIALIFCTATSFAQPVSDELEEEHALSMEFETPHTDWAQPYAGGKVRALFFLHIQYCGTVPREVVELKQRFDLEAEAVFWARIVDTTKEHWHGDAAGLARMRRLLAQPWDCYVFVGLPPERMGLEEQYRVFESVTKGAGIVLMGVNDPRILKPERKLELPEFLSSGVPFVGLPFAQKLALEKLPPEKWTEIAAASKLIQTFKVKAGRGVLLPARPLIEYRQGWETEYDYWQSMLGRAILWAAGREPKTSLNITAGIQSLDRTALPKKDGMVVTWRNAPAGKRLSLILALRSETGSIQPLPDHTVTTAEGQCSVEIPQLPAGQYYTDAILTGDQGTITWASTSFTVKSARVVKEIIFDKPFGEIGEKLSGKVIVENAAQPSAVLPQEKIRIDLCDRRNRVLMRTEKMVVNNVATFAFPVEEWLPMLVRVEATLLSGDTPVASVYEYFHVTKRHRGQFNSLMWDLPRGTLEAYGIESLARLGITVVLVGIRPTLAAQAYDLAWVPYTTHINTPHDEKGIMKPCCWNDEPKITQHVQNIVSKCEKDRQSGVFVYSLGDEIATRGSCLHPACLAAFRKYLQDEYKTIEALNASWGSNYTSFDEVALDPPDDDKANVAKQKGNYPRWYDRQAFQCYNFTRLCKRFVDAFARLDPQARVGFEGAGSFAEGDDYDLIVRTNAFWSPYPGLGDEIIRSIAPRDFIRSNWMGYTKDADSLLSKYWRMITRGCDSVWWWRWDGVGRFHGYLAPHLGPYKATAEIVKDTQVVRDGLGTLLLRSMMLDDGIAIVYSMPSAYACRVGEGPGYGSYVAAHEAWSQAIRELGLQYRYVTDRMLRMGEFKAAEFKVVLIPRMEAMGPQEAAVLRKFVQDGGTLIADLRPGVYDGHCKPMNKGALDDLFGITRTSANEKPLQADGEIGEGAPALPIPKILCDPGVTLAGGTPAGRCGAVPLVISKSYGKGRAVLLNFSINSFPSLRLNDTPRTADGFIGGLFASAGVEAAVNVLDSKGERERNLEIVRWQNGDAMLLALFREQGVKTKARLVLPKAMYVYDLRNRQYLGVQKSVDTDIIPCRATFFALTPREQPAVELALQSPTIERGSVGSVSLRGGAASGVTAVLVTVETPHRKPADWLKRVVMLTPSGATVPLPVAFNDPPGAWMLRATELYSNNTVQTTFTVR